MDMTTVCDRVEHKLAGKFSWSIPQTVVCHDAVCGVCGKPFCAISVTVHDWPKVKIRFIHAHQVCVTKRPMPWPEVRRYLEANLDIYKGDM